MPEYLIKDANSHEWLQVKKYCEKRLIELRCENDSDLSERETARLRGMIEYAKEIILLDAKPEVPAKVVDPTYT